MVYQCLSPLAIHLNMGLKSWQSWADLFFFGGSFEELSDPTNVFTIFGLNSDIPRDPREMGHGHHSHYQQMQYDPWTMDRRGGY